MEILRTILLICSFACSITSFICFVIVNYRQKKNISNYEKKCIECLKDYINQNDKNIINLKKAMESMVKTNEIIITKLFENKVENRNACSDNAGDKTDD